MTAVVLCWLAAGGAHPPLPYRTYPTLPIVPMFLPPPQSGPTPLPARCSEPDAAFYQKLKLCSGPRPTYHLVAWPIPGVVAGGGDIDWERLTAYPMRVVPDGYTIHAGITPHTGPYQEDADASWRVAFASADAHLVGDWAYTRHQGVRYLRGRVPRTEVPGLRQHQAFRVFTDYPLTPAVKQIAGPDGLTPITIRLAQTWAQNAHGEVPDGHTYLLRFPQGQQTALDQYAWEQW